MRSELQQCATELSDLAQFVTPLRLAIKVEAVAERIETMAADVPAAGMDEAEQHALADQHAKIGGLGFLVDGECVHPSRVTVIKRTLAAGVDGVGAVGVEHRMWDSQWVNVVNHERAYEGWDKEEAINHAVKLTEKAMARNIADGNWPPAPAALAATDQGKEG